MPKYKLEAEIVENTWSAAQIKEQVNYCLDAFDEVSEVKVTKLEG